MEPTIADPREDPSAAAVADGRAHLRHGTDGVPAARGAPSTMPVSGDLASWAVGLDVAWRAWAPELAAAVARLGLRPGDRVLDAGMGTGIGTRSLAHQVAPGGTVVGVDRDPEALEWAAWSLRDLADGGCSIELWCEDVTRLPFTDDQFDAAWCSSVLGYVPDPLSAIRELVRVVRPGGRVIVISGDAARDTFLPIDPRIELRLRVAELGALREGAWGTGVDLHVGRRLYALASRSGARSVEPWTIVWERTAPLRGDEHAYLERLLAGLVGPDVVTHLGTDLAACRAAIAPGYRTSVLHHADLHALQTAAAVVLTV